MDRKNFLKRCGMACLGGSALAAMLQSCAPTKELSGNIDESDLVISLKAFETKAGAQVHFKQYIIVHNDKLKFPIYVYRFDAQTYSALWLQCTHQGAELQVFGDKLQCPAHGSEFDNKGNVASGPAESNLRSFPVSVENDHLKISLKVI
ncbi:MAG: Rieske (2Fe-2S) protein [Chitinophagaceae bacterium]|jgi:Rieske Fe-S protein